MSGQPIAVGGATSATLGQVKRRSVREREQKGQWWRFALILVITAIVIVPIFVVFLLSVQPGQGSTQTGFTFEGDLGLFHAAFVAGVSETQVSGNYYGGGTSTSE